MDIFKKNQIQILKLKNIRNKIKYNQEFNHRLDQAEESISGLEDRSFEIANASQEKRK